MYPIVRTVVAVVLPIVIKECIYILRNKNTVKTSKKVKQLRK